MFGNSGLLLYIEGDEDFREVIDEVGEITCFGDECR